MIYKIVKGTLPQTCKPHISNTKCPMHDKHICLMMLASAKQRCRKCLAYNPDRDIPQRVWVNSMPLSISEDEHLQLSGPITFFIHFLSPLDTAVGYRDRLLRVNTKDKEMNNCSSQRAKPQSSLANCKPDVCTAFRLMAVLLNVLPQVLFGYHRIEVNSFFTITIYPFNTVFFSFLFVCFLMYMMLIIHFSAFLDVLCHVQCA